ncbi:membrane protein ribonuclease BN-like family protein [Janibacter sp. HTCC2649]|uniref:YihY/virulence factor BrkB family protein n=1 Tax=Janibacter sp. HTCC2649 TaxID=313589 RepID=UPI0000670FBB|nr:YihY/virulence factor BrkB family protein [Janibacter sp. HTCC2649]EAP97408.1 membrane protein ribonuclease BN-like family protein [Janibacter sp. HTCC2649]
MDRVKKLWADLQRTRLWGAWKRYGDARGNLLAGGVTYFAFFSIFPAVALAFTVFGVLLQGNPQWLDEIKDYLNQTLPGFIQDGGTEGLIPLTIPSGDTLTVTGLIGLAGLLFAGLGWLGALRDGIRTIFGVEGQPGNFVTTKLRDLGVLVILGMAIVVSAAVTGIAGAATSWVAEAIGLGGQAWLLSVIAFVVGAVLDGLVVLVMLRLLSGVDVPRRGLIGGAVIGGVGLTLLKVLGATVIAGTTSNPLFASIALVVGLLAWLNFMSRIVLLAAAWSANSLPLEAGAELTEGQRTKLLEGPQPAESVTRQAQGVTSESNPVTRHTDRVVAPAARRAEDRVNLALGAALGASTALGLGAATRLLRRVTSRR